MKDVPRLAVLICVLAGVTFLYGCPLFNDPPVAGFTANPASGQAPLRVSFSASNSSDPNGDSLTYTWNLGDGTTEAGKYCSHTYTTPGSYTVQLTVRDEGGLSATASKTIHVSEGPVPSDFTISNIHWEATRCWLIVSWPCLYVYGTVTNNGPYPARVDVDVTAYNSAGAVVGTSTIWGSGCDIPPGQSFVVEGKMPDINGPIESVMRVEGRVVGASPCK